MTPVELLAMPKGMSFGEYEKLLKDKQKLERKIKKTSDTIFTEEDSLEILADEVGSERYNKHLKNKRKAEDALRKARTQLEQIDKKLNG